MLKEYKNIKIFRSPEFNYNFNKNTGYTEVWGDTQEHNPEFAPFPVICDMEITKACHGVGTKYGSLGENAIFDTNPCPMCYKSNVGGFNRYMPFEKAANIISKLPKGLTQIAFGTDASLVTNPDWYKIFCYARDNGFIPNVTVADISEDTAQKLGEVCGAVAVSYYGYDEVFNKTIENLLKYKYSNNELQINVHYMLSEETIDGAYRLLENKHINDINAIVFLSLKKKGRGCSFNSLSLDKYRDIINTCKQKGISFGMDSCSAHKFLSVNEDKSLEVYVTPCESTLESAYINTEGMFFPCSFIEGTSKWKEGLDVNNCSDFITDIWNHPKTLLFREELLMSERHCPVYQI